MSINQGFSESTSKGGPKQVNNNMIINNTRILFHILATVNLLLPTPVFFVVIYVEFMSPLGQGYPTPWLQTNAGPTLGPSLHVRNQGEQSSPELHLLSPHPCPPQNQLPKQLGTAAFGDCK